jgi:hypothetical protein
MGRTTCQRRARRLGRRGSDAAVVGRYQDMSPPSKDEISAPTPERFGDFLITRDATKLLPDHACYSPWCRPPRSITARWRSRHARRRPKWPMRTMTAGDISARIGTGGNCEDSPAVVRDTPAARDCQADEAGPAGPRFRGDAVHVLIRHLALWGPLVAEIRWVV